MKTTKLMETISHHKRNPSPGKNMKRGMRIRFSFFSRVIRCSSVSPNRASRLFSAMNFSWSTVLLFRLVFTPFAAFSDAGPTKVGRSPPSPSIV